MRLVSVVMGSPSVRAREDASSALLNYGFNFYQTRQLLSEQDAGDDREGLEGRSD